MISLSLIFFIIKRETKVTKLTLTVSTEPTVGTFKSTGRHFGGVSHTAVRQTTNVQQLSNKRMLIGAKVMCK